jgi:hypothetical protein
MMMMRTTASAALLIMLGTMFATVPASATAPASAATTTPVVRLSGELVQVADQPGAGFAAISLADGALVPLKAESVKNITSGSAVTLDVAVPAGVRVAAAANRTLTTRGVDGKELRVPLRARDLAAASDGSPEGLPSAIGKATVAEAMAPGEPALEVSQVVTAAADPVSTYTPATRDVYVAVVTPAGTAPGPAVDVGRIGAQVTGASSYWDEVTAGGVKLRLANAIGARYTSAYGCSNPAGMWAEARQKVGLPSTMPANTTVVIVLPKAYPANCGYGLGTMGGNPNSWGYVYVADDVWPVLAHELGHNMSLQHANALLCPSAADSAYSETSSVWTGAGCSEDAYGDGQDVMAASTPSYAPYLSAPQSLRTGIIPPASAKVISTVGTQSVTLLPLAGPVRTGFRTAEVVNPVTGVTYYVEYRTKAGRDLNNVYQNVKTGVRVLRYNPDTGATVLLDPSPTGQSHDPDPTLPAGQTFTSYDGRISITTLSANSTNAVISVSSSAESLVQRYITRVYSDLFNRAPDPVGLATWTAALNQGTPRVAVANSITYSSEYRSRLIAGSYDHYLGRSPDPGGMQTWLGAMGRGWTISQMESGFIASSEYYAKAGSTDEGWVRELYSDVLGRSAAPSEVAYWTANLRRGMGRNQVAIGFLLSTERLRTVVDGHYRHLLGRGIDPSGQLYWVRILQAGGRDEAIIGGIIASAEYYVRN